MSISIVSNFKYQGPLANFERDQYATLSDMLNVNENILPPVFIGVCLETKKAYLYNVENTPDPVLGKWREIANGSDVNDAVLTIQKNGTTLDTFSANASQNKTINVTVPVTAADVNALPDTTTINDLTSQEQQDALNSGVTSSVVSQVSTNTGNIAQNATHIGELSTALATEMTTRESKDSELALAIKDIDDLIPDDATAQNQLADKAFVNSSIGTSTATFRGTYQSVQELPTTGVDENDYAFVVSEDAAGNTLYNRYKYASNLWQFEYSLNNSSFTAAQWSAINSTITESAKSGYDTHLANTDIHVTTGDKTTWNAKQNAITGAATTITSNDLTASRALVSNSNGKVSVSDITAVELGYLDNATSNIQDQLNAKVAQVSTNKRIYGTDANGAQTTYDYDSFGKVDDVKVGTESVVTNKIATLGTMAGETASDYRKSADQDVIDNAIKKDVSDLSSGLDEEVETRTNRDNALNDKIVALGTAVGGTFEYSQENYKYNYSYKIDQETPLTNIVDTDKVVKAIGKLDNAIATEATTRSTADGQLSTRINSEQSARISEDDSLRTSISTEVGRAQGVESALQTNVATSLKIQKNGTDLDTYQPSTNTNKTVNITIAVSDVTDLTATATELNTLHGITASTTELNYTDGVTSNIQTQLDSKVDENPAIAAATHTKITYDSKGLVTNGVDLAEADIPQLSESKITNLTTHLSQKQDNLTSENAGAGISIAKDDNDVLKITNTRTTIPWGNLTGTLSDQTDLQDALDTKVDENAAITAATHTKITYDSKGLVTNGVDLAEADIPALHLTKISDVTASAAELNYVDGVTAPIQNQITNISSNLDAEIDRSTTQDTTLGTYITNIQAVIPTAATSSNQLADKTYVNDLIQSTAADFRGSWDTYADIPTNPNLYPEDDEGNRKPGKNDYLLVQRDETQDGGTWRYKYTGDWDTDGKSGWTAEYEVNANPLTADQIAALDSGITDTLVAQITTNANNITSLTNSKQNNITGAASTVTVNNLDPSVVVISNSNGKIDTSTITIDELNNLFGTTSNLQNQLDGKQGSLTNAQMAAVDSGITATKVNNYDAHVANTTIHVTSADKTNWNAKQEALNETQMSAVNSTATQSKIDSYSNHIADTDIHITTTERSTWNAKQTAITGAATTITDQNLTINRAVVSDNNGKITASSITSAELGCLSNATDNIQSRLDNMIIFRTWS